VDSVSSILKSKRGSCRQEGSAVRCFKDDDTAERINVVLRPGPDNPDKLATLKAQTFSAKPSPNTAGRALAMSNLNASLSTLLAAALPLERETQKQIASWLPAQLANCPPDPVTIGGYKVSCDSPTKSTATRISGEETIWSASLTIDSTTAFR
jgi:hypothetical protein